MQEQNRLSDAASTNLILRDGDRAHPAEKHRKPVDLLEVGVEDPSAMTVPARSAWLQQAQGVPQWHGRFLSGMGSNFSEGPRDPFFEPRDVAIVEVEKRTVEKGGVDHAFFVSVLQVACGRQGTRRVPVEDDEGI